LGYGLFVVADIPKESLVYWNSPMCVLMVSKGWLLISTQKQPSCEKVVQP